MLTGYGNIPTAVAAVKAGAIDYITKPADADDVENALLALPESKAKPPENPMSADRVKWEHIHRVFELCDRNVSETARRLIFVIQGYKAVNKVNLNNSASKKG